MMASSNASRYHVFYSGRVQGVGFRFTTRQVARRHPVTGYVRNLPDGRVELVAEGRKEHVRNLLADIREAMEGYIADAEVSQSSATGEFDDFHVRH